MSHLENEYLNYFNDDEVSIFENMSEYFRKKELEAENQFNESSDSSQGIVDAEFDETTPKSSSLLTYGQYCKSKLILN